MKSMDKNIDDDQRREMENWPESGALTSAIIASAPKQKRINLYLAAGENKAMFQLTEEQAKDLVGGLSNAVDSISRGVQ